MRAVFSEHLRGNLSEKRGGCFSYGDRVHFPEGLHGCEGRVGSMTDMFEAKDVKPMLIGESREAFDSPDYIYELKMDGERCIAYLDPLSGTVLRNKRNINMLGKVPELGNIHKQVDARCILDGELIVAVDGEPNFYEIQRRVQMRDKFTIYLQSSLAPATFVASDILYHAGRETTSWSVLQRKELLEQTVTENERFVVSRYVRERGVEHYNLAAKRNLEGIIAKRIESRYYPDARSKDWIKCKNLQDDDFVVCGFIPKEERTVSVVLGKYDGDQLVYRGQMAMGASGDNYRIIATHRRAAIPPLGPMPDGKAETIWLAADLVCTVRHMNMPQAGMQQPMFRGYRMDKDAVECVVE